MFNDKGQGIIMYYFGRTISNRMLNTIIGTHIRTSYGSYTHFQLYNNIVIVYANFV